MKSRIVKHLFKTQLLIFKILTIILHKIYNIGTFYNYFNNFNLTILSIYLKCLYKVCKISDVDKKKESSLTHQQFHIIIKHYKSSTSPVIGSICADCIGWIDCIGCVGSELDWDVPAPWI